jgi:hypothetical protein
VHATPQDCLKSCIEEPNIDNRDREKGTPQLVPSYSMMMTRQKQGRKRLDSILIPFPIKKKEKKKRK